MTTAMLHTWRIKFTNMNTHLISSYRMTVIVMSLQSLWTHPGFCRLMWRSKCMTILCRKQDNLAILFAYFVRLLDMSLLCLQPSWGTRTREQVPHSFIHLWSLTHFMLVCFVLLTYCSLLYIVFPKIPVLSETWKCTEVVALLVI